MERFTGKFDWQTMGGSVDVIHPDGRRVRTGPVYGEQDRIIRALPKGAKIEVEIPDQRRSAGTREPRIISFPGREP
jgi:hypothetical protein